MSMIYEQIRDEALQLSDDERRALANELAATLSFITDEDDSELDELLTSQPLTGEEIAAQGLLGGWEDLRIEDSSEWVNNQRRQRREKRGWTL